MNNTYTQTNNHHSRREIHCVSIRFFVVVVVVTVMILCISVLVVRIPDLDIPHDFVRFYQLNLSPSTCDDALNRNGYWSMVYKLYIE